MKLIFVFVICNLIFASVYAESLPIKKQILISVGDFKEGSQDTWKKEICYQAYLLANQVVQSGVDVQCHSIQTDQFLDADLQRLLKKSDYHIRILRNLDDSIKIYFSKLGKIHETDFDNKGLNFKDDEKSKTTKEAALTKVLGNFFFYVDNETAFKAGLLFNGVQESKEIEFDQNKGVFLDSKTKTPLSINKAYAIFEKESPRIKNYLRTGIEIGVLLSSAMAIYYKNLVFNQVDFDYGLKDGLQKKLITGEAIRFDNNDKMSNYGHVFAGVSYYQVARANGFNSLESFLITLGSSTAWELLEYHEVLSINDQILTPLGGYVIGEASYQISCALFQKDSKVAKALGYVINPGLAVNHGIDKLKKNNPFASQPDCRKPRWSDISVYVGLEQGRKAYDPKMNNNLLVGLDALVINIENTGVAGKDSNLAYDPLAKLLIEANRNGEMIDLRIIAQVVSAAYHKKNLTTDEKGQLRGYDLILGIGSATTWDDRGTKEGSKNEDFYGTINILGATAHANIRYKGFTIEADFGFYGDFTMVKSYSLSAYEADQPEGLKGSPSVLKRKGYYWGMGTTTLAAISLQNGPWEVGYSGQQSSAKSIHGNDRLQEQVTNNDTFRDSIKINRVFISYQITKNLKLQLSREHRSREGSVASAYNTAGTEKRTMGTLVYQF